MEDKSIVYQAVSLMDRYYNQKDLQAKPHSDAFLTGFTSIFIASKNSEVEPISLSDVKNHLLQGNYSRQQILLKENHIRKASNYENEVTTMFDYIMLYMKIWKVACQTKIGAKHHHYVSTYKFICEVESTAYDFTKSLLIDAESLKHKSSIMVAAIVSVSIEIIFQSKIDERKKDIYVDQAGQKVLPILTHMEQCNKVWDSILKRMFGKGSIEFLDSFGRYLFLRQ